MGEFLGEEGNRYVDDEIGSVGVDEELGEEDRFSEDEDDGDDGVDVVDNGHFVKI